MSGVLALLGSQLLDNPELDRRSKGLLGPMYCHLGYCLDTSGPGRMDEPGHLLSGRRPTPGIPLQAAHALLRMWVQALVLGLGLYLVHRRSRLEKKLAPSTESTGGMIGSARAAVPRNPPTFG
jgi:hypothetical protein